MSDKKPWSEPRTIKIMVVGGKDWEERVFDSREAEALEAVAEAAGALHITRNPQSPTLVMIGAETLQYALEALEAGRKGRT